MSGGTLFYVAGRGETNDLKISQGSGGTTIVHNGATSTPAQAAPL